MRFILRGEKEGMYTPILGMNTEEKREKITMKT